MFELLIDFFCILLATGILMSIVDDISRWW